MDAPLAATLRSQLLDRRERLVGAVAELPGADDLLRLLREIDGALERMDSGRFGRCEVCTEPIDEPDLRAKPLLPYCLCKLSPLQQAALEHDLGLAARVQWSLLPREDLEVGGWEAHFRYEPAGPVSGDYCDVVAREDSGSLYAMVGDVSGKGVAASLLMARLSALLRSLIDTGLPIDELVGRSSQLFAEGKPASHYATLVAARAMPDGQVEVCNAGHCRPLVVQDGRVRFIQPTGFPIGLVSDRAHPVEALRLGPGDTLLLYTDGLTEAFDAGDRMYGTDRLSDTVERSAKLSPRQLGAALLADQAAFLQGASRGDDLALLVLRRAA